MAAMHPDAPLVGVFFLLLLAAGTPVGLLLMGVLRHRLGRRATAGFGVAALLACLAGAVLLYLHQPRREFSLQYWAEQADMRYTLRTDLIASRRLLGLSRQQVLALLGPPSPHYSPSDGELLFDLGYPPALTTSVRPDVLTVRFDDAGRVTDVR
jgi:hypothetical protein